MTNSRNTPSYRRPLNDNQLLLLNTLYKFRFATIKLISESQKANPRVISSRLKILVDQDYIAMNYDGSYRIKGRPATYYLTTKAVRHLRTKDYINESALRSIYHDKRATDSQIEHRLGVFRLHNHVKHTYPDRFKFYSKTELMNKDYLPKQRPDAMIEDRQGSSKVYLVEYIDDDTSFWNQRKIVKKYINYAEQEAWNEYRPSQTHPTVLFICDSETMRRRMKRISERELDGTYVDIDIQFKDIGKPM